MLALIVIGLFAIKSATYNHPYASGNFNKQLFFAFISLGIFFAIYFMPHRFLRFFALPSYGFTILLLLAVLVIGKSTYGAKSWISLGPVGFQPSEIGKIGLILALSYWLGKANVALDNVKDFSVAVALAFLPLVLILAQPDMGTAIIYMIVTISLFFWAGIDLFGLFVLLSPPLLVFISFFGVWASVLAVAAIIGVLFYFKKDLFTSITVFVINISSIFLFEVGLKFLKPHQQKRILSFLNPSADPLGSGYNAIQASVAVGSGGLFGKGYMHGSQTQLRFIPEQWTDFIFSVIGEEFGFIGSALVVILFSIIFYRLLRIAIKSKDNFSSLTVIGILTVLLMHFFINIGMNIGLAPVVGIPLPFMSYGGTALIVNVAMIAIAMNIFANNKEHA
jgi:rod shape determining protein RodA